MEIEKKLFRLIEKDLWLVDRVGHGLAKTKGAAKLEEEYLIDLVKIIEISQGQGCARHSTQAFCLNCPLEGSMSPQGFPLVLATRDGEEEREFWGRVDVSGEELLLQITPQKEETVANHSMFDYLNDARELERKQIAQDLHDGIAQSIYSLMLETRSLKWLENDDQTARLKEIDRHFSEVLKEVKNLAGELRPMSLDAFGLVPALEQFIERTKQMTGFEVEMTLSGANQPLSEAVRITIYRIIQEAITNAMKYSGVNSAEVVLDFRADYLIVGISDQGEGFDLIREERGFGLQNMKERAHSIHSELLITSEIGQGTMIYLQIPLKERQHELINR